MTYFNKETFGENKIVSHPYCNFPHFIEGLPRSTLSHEAAVQQAPLSDKGKRQLLRVLKGGLHEVKAPKGQLKDYARSHSYFDYLKNTLGVDDPGVLKMARNSSSDWAGIGSDVLSIKEAESCGAMGFSPAEKFAEDHPCIHHFPDGNAGVARALVKKMIPNVGPGRNAEEFGLIQIRPFRTR